MTGARMAMLLGAWCGICLSAGAQSLGDFSTRFWEWRADEQPFSVDDIPRIERHSGLLIDWSATAIARHQAQLDAFEHQWRAMALSLQRWEVLSDASEVPAAVPLPQSE